MQVIVECTELKRRGHEVALLCHPKSRLEQEAKAANIETLALELRATNYPVALGTLRRFLARRRIEIIDAQVSQDLSALVPAAIFIPRPPSIILTKRVGSFVGKKDAFHRWLYRHVALVIAVSEVIRKNVIDTCPIDADRVVTLFDGVDLEKFDPDRVHRMAFRKEMGLGEDDFVVGMVGRFSPGKGHEEFIDAASMIHSRSPEIKFVVVGEPSRGEDEYGKSVHERGKSLASQGAMIFTGFRTDIPEVMAALDLLAFPSHAEAFGDVLIEAMAMKVPIVSTNCDGVIEIVVDGETGIQVPPRDARALSDALVRLVQDKELRRNLGEAGRRRVEKMFDLTQRTNALEKLYARVLDRTSGLAMEVAASSVEKTA